MSKITSGNDEYPFSLVIGTRKRHSGFAAQYIHIFLLYGIDSSRDMSTHLNSDITDVPPQTNEDVNKKQDRNVSNKLTSFGTYTNGKDSKSVTTSLHKFDKLIITKDNDGVTVILQEELNDKCSLYDLEKQKQAVKAQLAANPIEQIMFQGDTLDRELADLLNQIDSAYLRDSPSSRCEIYDVNFSRMPKAMFNELFGQLLRPNHLSFFAVRGIDGGFFLRNVKNFGSKYVDVMPLEKATNPIVNMTELIECIGSKNFGICPKPVVFRTNHNFFGLKIGHIVHQLHEAFQAETVQITYRLVILCRLTDVQEWTHEMFKRRELKPEDIERFFNFLYKNPKATPEQMINEYNEVTKVRFVVKIRKSAFDLGKEMFSILDNKVVQNDFNMSVQIHCEV
ncbi:hypothetical protein DdX_14186 [Ditylenchus destructor]|uniref:Uncharacterized protein n=1 Tax=Ditylenchus destructor TaxID=166010 RepID=A0AAD4MXC0_9BILA|nr:hypothetical protein DdX_14186 [Ditylenchus destructor]